MRRALCADRCRSSDFFALHDLYHCFCANTSAVASSAADDVARGREADGGVALDADALRARAASTDRCSARTAAARALADSLDVTLAKHELAVTGSRG